MRVSGSYILDSDPTEVWGRVFDPASLASLIPGCERLVQISSDEYRGEMSLALPAVSGSFETYVKILEQREPDICRLKGEITGPTGIIAGTAFFSLQQVDAQTRLEYQGDALITGALAKMPARFIEGVAATLLRKGLAKLNKDLQRGSPEQQQAVVSGG